MFVVATANRSRVDGSAEAVVNFPVVIEDEKGYVSAPVAFRDTRVLAQKLADALNKALDAN